MADKGIPVSSSPSLLRRGCQVAYVPDHAEGDLSHPDVEFGFVSSYQYPNTSAFVRYWHKGQPGKLRTTANSQSTRLDHMVYYASVEQYVVDQTLEDLYG